MHSANSLALLIPAAPALLFVIAAKKAQKQQPKEPPVRVENWTWPKKWRRVARSGDGRTLTLSEPVAKTGGR